MNCVLYARVSTDKQADKELSIPAQLQAMREYASARGWTIVREYVEPGASGRTTNRPILKELLAAVRSDDTKINVLLVHKIDRLARNLHDHATIRALLQQRGVTLASAVENVDDSISGQLVENIMASIAQFYSANLGEEVRKGMRQKVLRGGWPHMPPRGYVVVRAEGGRSMVERHVTGAVLIQKMFSLYSTGVYSLKRLSRRMAAQGLSSASGRPLATAYLRRLLTNPFYIGRLQWADLNQAGNHEALISIEMFTKVQQVLKARTRDCGTKGTIAGFPLRGVAICAACRGRMTAERHKKWGYYRCGRNAFRSGACPASFCNADKANRDVEQILRGLRITRAMSDQIMAVAGELLSARTASARTRAAELRGIISAAMTQEREATTAFAAGDLLPKAYRLQLSLVRERAAAAQKLLDRSGTDRETVLTAVQRTLDHARSLADWKTALSPARQAELIQAIFSTIVVSKTGVVSVVMNSPFESLTRDTLSVGTGSVNDQAVTNMATDLIAEASIRGLDQTAAPPIPRATTPTAVSRPVTDFFPTTEGGSCN